MNRHCAQAVCVCVCARAGVHACVRACVCVLKALSLKGICWDVVAGNW